MMPESFEIKIVFP